MLFQANLSLCGMAIIYPVLFFSQEMEKILVKVSKRLLCIRLNTWQKLSGKGLGVPTTGFFMEGASNAGRKADNGSYQLTLMLIVVTSGLSVIAADASSLSFICSSLVH